MGKRQLCKCGATCDYYSDADPCEGQIVVEDADAVCPPHWCAKHKRRVEELRADAATLRAWKKSLGWYRSENR